MAVVFKNNAKTTLASSLSSSATSVSVADGSVFPSLGSGEIFFCTLDDGTNNEIVKVTAVSSNTLTVVRAQESTTARSFASGDAAELRLTAGILSLFSQTGVAITDEIEAYLDANGLTFPDSVIAKFGASNDLKIQHNGTNSFIDNETGGLYIRQKLDDGDVLIQSDNGSGGLTNYFKADGSNGQAQLFHYGSQKLNTTSSGIDVTGVAVVDGLTSSAAITSTSNSNSLGNTTISALIVDDITIDGSTISDSGSLTLDVGGGITFDADGGQVDFKDNGTLKALIDFTGNNVEIQSRVTDGDLLFRGQDGSSFITALTLDMSNAGAATFNSTISSGAITSSGDITLAANLKATGNNLKLFAGGNHIINMDLNGNFYPQTHNAVDLGFSDSLAFRNLHLVGAITGGATISSGAITSTGNSVFTGSGSSGNAFQVKRGNDGSQAFRVQNAGEVVVANNYLYASHTGTAFYSQGQAVFRNGILNDGGDLAVKDTLNITNSGVLKMASTTVMDASRNLTNIGTISSGAISATQVGVTNIVTNKVVKFNGSILDDSSITDTGSAITLGNPTTVTGNFESSNHILAQGYYRIHGSGILLQLEEDAWTNADTHHVLYNGWTQPTGDYVYLAAAGNGTPVGTIVISDSGGFYFGTKSSTTGAITASATAPLTNTRFRVDASGNGTFVGSIQGSSFSDGTISGITFIDEDSFSTNSATRVPTQQSVKAYVDAQVAGVVDSAPSALNTLNELAAALGDDSNFATTTSTSLGNRLRVDTASQGLTATQQGNAITNLGITATKAELNFVDGVTSNIQTQLNARLTSSSSLNASNISSGTLSNSRLPTQLKNNHLLSGSNAILRFGETDVTNTPVWWQVADGGNFSIRLNNSGGYPFIINTNSDNNAVSSIGLGYATTIQGNTAWHAGNDGSGSGLDADLLDGVQASSFLRSDAADSASGTLDLNGRVNMGFSVTRPAALNSDSVAQARIGGNDVFLYVASLGASGGYDVAVQAARASDFASFDLNLQSNGGNLQRAGNKVWDAGNDGSGSGLDADTLDGINSGSFLRSDATDSASGLITLGNGVIITKASSDQNTSQDSASIPSTSGAEIVKFQGGYTNGQYTTEFAKVDRSGNLPLYVRQSKGTANSFSNIARFGDHGQTNGSDVFAVFGGARVSGRVTADNLTLNSLSAQNSEATALMINGSNVVGTRELGSNAFNSTTIPTNNNQLTNGAGYTTYSSNQATNTNSTVTFNQVIATNNGNGTNFRVGDDAWLGDTNVANTIQITGVQDSTQGYLVFGSSDNTQLGRSGTGALTYGGNTVWHAGSDGSGSGLDADTLDGIQATGFVKQLSNSSTPDYQTPSSRRVNPNSSNPTNEHYAITTFGNSGNVTGQLATHFQTGEAFTRGYNNSFSAWRKHWDATNDGSGSGLDADTVDGIQGGSFLRSDTADTATGQIFFDAGFDAHPIMLSGTVNMNNVDRSGFYNLYNINSGSTGYAGFPYGTMIAVGNDKGSQGFGLQIAHERTNTQFKVRGMNDTGSAWSSWATIWTSAIDGSGSGLDADLLDGVQGSSYLRSDASDTYTGTLTVNGSIDLSSTDTAANYIHMPRGGGITFYGDTSSDHGIFSRNNSNNSADDILITSYGAVYIDLDSNNNNTSGADFIIGRHNSTSQNLFSINGETAHSTLGYDGQNPNFKLIYDDNHGNGDGWDTVIQLGRLQDRHSGSGVFPTYQNVNGYGLYMQGNSDGCFFGMEEYNSSPNFRPVIAWGDDTTDSPFFIRYNNSAEFAFTYDGKFHADDDIIAFSTTTSDARYKDNVSTIENALDKVQKIRGVEFDWNATSKKGKHDIGFIAQEIEEVVPEIVSEQEMLVGDFENTEEKAKTVAYGQVTALLVEAVKEQQDQIEYLKSELIKLKENNNGSND